jgi:hypothetical protein
VLTPLNDAAGRLEDLRESHRVTLGWTPPSTIRTKNPDDIAGILQ